MKNLFRRKYLFRSNDSKFELRTSLQIVSIPIVALIFFGFQFWVFLRSTYSFFAANKTDVFNMPISAFYDATFANMTEQLPFLGVYLALIFFVGSYVSVILLRQFRKIEDYCDHSHAQDEFKLSGLEKSELLTKISHDFFAFISNCRESKKFEGQEIKEEYKKQTAPPVDWVFYLHYFSILAIITIFSGALLHVFIVDTYDSVINMANAFLDASDGSLKIFLNTQAAMLEMIFYSTMAIVVFLYAVLSHHIIAQVTGVSFAFFRTMKEIMEGDFSLRIRLRFRDPGHAAAYKFNRYLDSVIPKGQSYNHKSNSKESA